MKTLTVRFFIAAFFLAAAAVAFANPFKSKIITEQRFGTRNHGA